jgi:CarD family transcriptional regulator
VGLGENIQLQKTAVNLKCGAKVVYPAHGIGVVEKVEKIKANGGQMAFYTIRLDESNMTIQVPDRSVSRIGIRAVIGKKEVTKLMRTLKKPHGRQDSILNWHKRQKSYLERIKSGSVFELAEILAELNYIMTKKELSFGEQRMYENVRELLVLELAEAKGIERKKADLLLEKAFAS